MYWIRNIIFSILTILVLNGCYGAIAQSVMIETSAKPNPKNGRVYLERFDNEEFLEYILKNNYIEGLKKEDVLYIDNAFTGGFRSYKLVFTKFFLYKVSSGFNFNSLSEYKKNKTIYIYSKSYFEENSFLSGKIKDTNYPFEPHYSLYIYSKKESPVA